MVDLIGITLAGLLDRPVKAALERLWPPAGDLRAAVSSLVSGQEQQRLAPVCQAASHLELGELQAARDCLLRAESYEPHAPVVKLALAMALARAGVTGEPVDRRISEALCMNPLLAPADLAARPRAAAGRHRAAGSGARSASPQRAASPERVAQTAALGANVLAKAARPAGNVPVPGLPGTTQHGAEPSPAWVTALTQAVIRKNGSARLSDSAAYSRLMSAAVACHPARASGLVVTAWHSRSLTAPGGIQCLGAFDVSSGSMQWGRIGKQADRQIILAAPATLILRPRNSAPGSLEVTDATTGVHLASFSPAAFRLLFWPAWTDRHLSDDARYQRSHHDFAGSQRVEQLDTDARRLLAGELRRDADFAAQTEEARLSDPLDPSSEPLVTAANVEQLRNHTMGLRRYFAPGSAGGRFWSTVVSSQPPGVRMFSCRATLSRSRAANPVT